ncbi:transposase [Mesorhizobium sp. M1378]|uniref:transposase n=1 Tax=Mesorhizobium sp. M1378 TaxID=2957092 RepID=UPI003335DA57
MTGRQLEPCGAHHRPHRGGRPRSDIRFIVTNLASGKAKALYEDLYCRRGAPRTTSSPGRRTRRDRTSCTRATANQFRLLYSAC